MGHNQIKRLLASALWHKIPERYRIPIDIYRRKPYWVSSGVIFIHVPKTAGVSVSNAIYGRPLGHFYATEVRRIYPELYERLFTFSVVRHPLARLISAYRFAVGGGTREMGIKKKKKYNSSLFSTFDGFVNDWLCYQDLNIVDGVFRPQNLYVCNNKQIIVDKVIKMEDLAQGMIEVSRILGRDIVVRHSNKSKEVFVSIGSKETISVIRHLYRDDFDIFSYSMDMF